MSSTENAWVVDDETAAEPVLAKRKLEDSEMDITPMIDMTFLLLIFFIVTSKIRPDSGVALPAARRGMAVATKDSVILTVAPGDPVSAVYKGPVDPKSRVPGTTAEEQEEAIVAYIESAVAQGNKKAVLIQAEKGLKHREVARVARAAARAEVENLYVGVMEKK